MCINYIIYTNFSKNKTGLKYMNQYDIVIMGGDRRIACMAPVFSRKGYQVTCYGTQAAENICTAPSLKEALDASGTVVCGIPFEKDGCLFCESQTSIPLPELQRCLRKHQKIFGGVIPEDFRRLCEEREIGCYDFMRNEPLTLFNAVATAEGAILEALAHKETVLHKSDCLVLGFGRCGSLIAQRLRGLSAHVTVSAGNPVELSMADSRGFFNLPLGKLKQEISRFDYVFNTIPACFLDEKTLRHVHRDCLIIDIASGRVGVDYKAAEALSLNVLYCPGLPGKYASVSCAEKLAEFVISNIHSKKKGV